MSGGTSSREGVSSRDISDLLYSESTEKEIRHQFQRVQLTGLGCTAFDKTIKNIQKIQDRLQTTLPEGMVEKWSATYTLSGHSAIDTANRYVTHVKDKGSVTTLPVTDSMDPYGTLRKAMNKFWFYMEDNEIECYERIIKKVDEEGNKKYR